MRRMLVVLVLACTGCRHCGPDVPARVETAIASVAQAHAVPDILPCSAALAAPPGPPGPVDLPSLWQMALAHNPALREAAAELEAQHGKLIQARLYPNPQLIFQESTFGNSREPPGQVQVEVSQKILTAGKFSLDQAIAGRGVDAATTALLGRKFSVLTRIRHAYNDYLGWRGIVAAHDQVVDALRQGVEMTRKLVEEVQSRPRTDLVRLQALLTEAQVNRDASATFMTAAWRELAAEVGVPCLPPPAVAADNGGPALHWCAEDVRQRVLAVHSDLKQAALEADRARLEVQRARAEAVPNVTVGGGYSHDYLERVEGAIVSVQTTLPLWDCRQGQIHEARARMARAEAALRSAENNLTRDAAEAFGRYEAARQQVNRLTSEVLPALEESLNLLRRGYQVGRDVTFLDVMTAQISLNETRLKIAEARRNLWLAVADLQGLMQLDLNEELAAAERCPPRLPGLTSGPGLP
jgi:cobalt-zinc-cadmium efflux system outer membrane protein